MGSELKQVAVNGHGNQSRILQVYQVAQVLGITENAVRIALSEGRIQGRKWGQRTVVLREDLERFLESLPRVKPRERRIS